MRDFQVGDIYVVDGLSFKILEVGAQELAWRTGRWVDGQMTDHSDTINRYEIGHMRRMLARGNYTLVHSEEPCPPPRAPRKRGIEL